MQKHKYIEKYYPKKTLRDNKFVTEITSIAETLKLFHRHCS